MMHKIIAKFFIWTTNNEKVFRRIIIALACVLVTVPLVLFGFGKITMIWAGGIQLFIILICFLFRHYFDLSRMKYLLEMEETECAE